MNKIICEILLELDIEIDESSDKDRVAGQIHHYIEHMKQIPFKGFTIGSLKGDYNFSDKPEEPSDDTSLEGDPDKMIKV